MAESKKKHFKKLQLFKRTHYFNLNDVKESFDKNDPYFGRLFPLVVSSDIGIDFCVPPFLLSEEKSLSHRAYFKRKRIKITFWLSSNILTIFSINCTIF